MKSIENPLKLMVFNRLNVCMFLSVKYCQSIVGGMFWETQTWQLSGAQKTKTRCIPAGFIVVLALK